MSSLQYCGMVQKLRRLFSPISWDAMLSMYPPLAEIAFTKGQWEWGKFRKLKYHGNLDRHID